MMTRLNHSILTSSEPGAEPTFIWLAGLLALIVIVGLVLGVFMKAPQFGAQIMSPQPAATSVKFRTDFRLEWSEQIPHVDEGKAGATITKAGPAL
jgi:hypothetical protein